MAQLNICNVLRSISDDKALALFNIIALAHGTAKVPINRLKLTKKQYYSRMSAMINSGLVARRNGKYTLTSFGKVVYEAHALVGKAYQSYWKLKAIDAIDSSVSSLASEERDRFITSLLTDNHLKEILLGINKNGCGSQELLVPHQAPDTAKTTKIHFEVSSSEQFIES